MPVADSGTVRGEPVASLLMVALPATAPALDGAKTTLKVAASPGARITPVGTPLAVKPAPVRVTFVIVMKSVLVLVRVALAVLEIPMLTVPKFKPADGFGVSWPGAALTESMAGLLVTLPTALLTTTVNNVPFVDVAGDV